MVNRGRAGVGVFLLAAVLGVTVLAAMAWRSVSILEIDASEALHNFEDARMSVPSTTPLVERDASGNFMRGPSARTRGPTPTELHALAYQVNGNRLVRADVPLWFLKVKGPAFRYAVRDTSLDLDALNLTATDLENAGAGIVLDETRSNGDRLLVWTD